MCESFFECLRDGRLLNRTLKFKHKRGPFLEAFLYKKIPIRRSFVTSNKRLLLLCNEVYILWFSKYPELFRYLTPKNYQKAKDLPCVISTALLRNKSLKSNRSFEWNFWPANCFWKFEMEPAIIFKVHGRLLLLNAYQRKVRLHVPKRFTRSYLLVWMAQKFRVANVFKWECIDWPPFLLTFAFDFILLNWILWNQITFSNLEYGVIYGCTHLGLCVLWERSIKRVLGGLNSSWWIRMNTYLWLPRLRKIRL